MLPTSLFVGSIFWMHFRRNSSLLLNNTAGDEEKLVASRENTVEAIDTNISEENKKLKKSKKSSKPPLTSLRTRGEGELEAAEKQLSSALHHMKNLARNKTDTLSPEFILAEEELHKSKMKLRTIKKRKLAKRNIPTSWHCYPPPCDIPRDPVDPRYSLSFDALSLFCETKSTSTHQAALDFFNEYGYVVFSNVLSLSECEATETEIWEHLEEKISGLHRCDPTTHSLLSQKRYGLPDEQAIFTRQLLLNRQNRRLYAALDCIVRKWPGCGPSVPETDSPGPNSIVVSHDRWCVYPPAFERPDRETENPPVHLDLCPWTYLPNPSGGSKRGDCETDPELLTYDGSTRIRQLKDWRAEINCVRGEFGPHVQGVISLQDNEECDGGTVIVPRFHKKFEEWQSSLGTWKENRVGQRRRGCSYNFHDPSDPIHQLARRVPIKAGSLLLWNQCTVHGAVPNRSKRFRIAQFVRGVRAGELGYREDSTSKRAQARSNALLRELKRASAGKASDKAPILNDLAPHVFQLSKDISIVEGENEGSLEKGTLLEKHWNI